MNNGLDSIHEINDKLFKLEDKKKNKEDNLRISMEEIEKIQNEIESLKVNEIEQLIVQLEESELIKKKEEIEAEFVSKRQRIQEQSQST